MRQTQNTGFTPHSVLPNGLGRAGTLSTPHGHILTPAFIPVGTKATVKSVLPEDVAKLGAQAVLANAYHLYLQPGPDIVEMAGGLGKFMNWKLPTFTDSGGFQVLSLGAGFKKVLSQDYQGQAEGKADAQVAPGKDRLAQVDEQGVWFTSHLDGSQHRFTPEISMRIQHQLGADIIFAFDELTTLLHSRAYQEESLERTRRWAEQCLVAHQAQTTSSPDKPYQQLFGVLQGANYEDLRRKAARDLGSMNVNGQAFDGFGIGGALEKERLGTIVSWVAEELPFNKARHLLGISEVDDFFAAIENGADTFDCVNPSRVARNGAIYTMRGRYNIQRAENRADFGPLEDGCGCYTCQHYSRAYIRHLAKAKEMLVNTLTTIHNEYFTVQLVANIRKSIIGGYYEEYKAQTLANFYAS